jgi:hypothetical protein
MKHLIIALLTAISISSFAQNGGQFPENGSVKLEYIGGGKVMVYNKQSCEAVINVKDGIAESNLTVPGNSYGVYTISAGLTSNFIVKAKTTTNCGGTDFGNVELFIASLPVTFTSIGTEFISYGNYWVNFEIADPKNVKQYNIQVSYDGGKSWVNKALLWPEDSKSKYSVKVNILNK